MNMAKLMNLLINVNTSGISDSGLINVMTQIGKIGQTILNIIYIVLGLFLVIKGALLGMQIVKAADEPQVRQEKISSLKWLVIGVAIGYGVAGAANILISVISGSLNFN